jgi:homogentisate 1,2-dioxygenase
MPFYIKNTEGDDVWFVHKGKGTVQTIFGEMTFKTGDYLVFPRGTFYQISPETKENSFLIIESREEITIPDRNILGPNALYDPAMIDTPDPNPLENGGLGKETIARYKRNNKFTHYTYPYDIGRNVTGWKGDVTAWKLSIHDFRPIMSHRYHLPPSVHTTFLSQGFVICSFVPRPFEMSEDAIKIPFFHSNVEYDEIIFYHDGNFFSRDNIKPGMVTFHPAGFTHGPHPKALKNMLKQDKPMTDEYAVMVDTRKPLEIPEEVRRICDPNYWKSWMNHE